MEHIIAIIGVISWPVVIYFTMKSLFLEVDKQLSLLADKRLEKAAKAYEDKHQELSDKISNLKEQVTVIQNGLQWKK